MQRRSFFKLLASGLAVAAAPQLFIPKLVKPTWRPDRYPHDIRRILTENSLKGIYEEIDGQFIAMVSNLPGAPMLTNDGTGVSTLLKKALIDGYSSPPPDDVLLRPAPPLGLRPILIPKFTRHGF